MTEPEKALVIDNAFGRFIIPPERQRLDALASWANGFKTQQAIEKEIANIRLQEQQLREKTQALMERAVRLGGEL